MINSLVLCGLHRWDWDIKGFAAYTKEVKKALQIASDFSETPSVIDLEYLTEECLKPFFEKTIQPKNAAYEIASRGC